MSMSKKIIAFPKTLAFLKGSEELFEHYAEALTNVYNYTVALTKIEVPTLHCDPEVSQKVQEYYEIINADAASWVQVVSRFDICLNIVPDYLNYIEGFAEQALQIVNKIYISKIYEQLLSDLLNTSSVYASEMKRMIDDCYANVYNFINKDAYEILDNLDEICKQLENEEAVDNEKIDELNKLIDELDAEIASLENALEVFSPAAAMSVGFLVLGMILGGSLVRAVCGVVFGIPLAIAGTYMTLDGIKLHKDKQALDAALTELDDRTQDVVVIQQLERQFKGFLDNANTILTDLGIINEAWGTMMGECQDIIYEISDSETELQEKDWSVMQETLTELINTCELLRTHMNFVNVGEATVSTAQIDFGMSAEEIEAAVNAAEKIPYVDYMMTVV